ncbi:MAG: DNA topoisomerase IV [Croceitalea sp.]|nr:DNA topoisomerase IV [Croceitalea sp.]NNL07934.1 DNA topoisomerase IV [Croceitalea sp.]NNM17260.1 DNA topoisomerase IV [Croceitalea sp.]
MNKTLVPLVIIILVSCQSPQRNCVDFKTGTFEFSSEIDGEVATTTFVRNNDHEIESFRGSKDTSTLRWINDCEYILKRINPTNRDEEKPIHIKILTTSDSSYTFEFNVVGETNKLRGTAYKK